MYSLLAAIALMILVFFVARHQGPWLAGLLAVIPLKIVATGFMSFELGGKEHLTQAVSGMLTGQTAWAVILAVLLCGLEYAGD